MEEGEGPLPSPTYLWVSGSSLSTSKYRHTFPRLWCWSFFHFNELEIEKKKTNWKVLFCLLRRKSKEFSSTRCSFHLSQRVMWGANGKVLMGEVLMGDVLMGGVPKGKAWQDKYKPKFTSPLTSLPFQFYWDRDSDSIGVFHENQCSLGLECDRPSFDPVGLPPPWHVGPKTR